MRYSNKQIDMENSEPTVTISRKEYDQLQHDQDWLECLEYAGVDNWEGYEYAIDIWDEKYPEREL